MTNLIDKNKRNTDEPDNGYACYHLYRDRTGQPFQKGIKKYVIFHYGSLVGEYDTLRDANIGYARGDYDGHKMDEYVGVQK